VVVSQERFDEMPEPKFLYGSHYSSPAHVLFFLARAGIIDITLISHITRVNSVVELFTDFCFVKTTMCIICDQSELMVLFCFVDFLYFMKHVILVLVI